MTSTPTSYRNALASLGYSCLVATDLLALFAPVLPYLDFLALPQALVVMLCFLAARVGTYVFCRIQADAVLVHRKRLLPAIVIGFSSMLVVSLISAYVSPVPLIACCLAWMLFGVGSSLVSVLWGSYFSVAPTRGTHLAIAGGAVIGTIFFTVTATTSIVAVTCFTTLFLYLSSLALFLFLDRKVAEHYLTDPVLYNERPTLTSRATLSVASHGIIYGFLVCCLCSMGFTAAVLGGTSGMIGVIAASIGATMITKVNMGTGIGQRIALPVSVFCLLLVPLVDDTGRLLCFCAINAVLAHSSVIAWSHTTVENSEFKLHPIKRHASHQIPSWLGFAGGVIIGLVLTRWYPSVGGNEWYIAIVFIISLAVLAFALSLGDDSMIERMLTDLLDNAYATDKNGIEPGTTATAAPEGLPPAPPPGVSALSGTAGPTLEERCSVICESYGLSAREAEVFVLLAQGRSVKRLQEKLFITEATVKSHIYHIYRKMGISNRQGLLDLVERQNDVG